MKKNSIQLAVKSVDVQGMFRRFRTIALLAAAAGSPYVASETETGREVMHRVFGKSSIDSGFQRDVTIFGEDQERTQVVGYANHSHHEVEKLHRIGSTRYRYDEQTARRLGAIPNDPRQTPQLAGTPINDLRQVLRFDISTQDVIRRFSRVSTVLADMRMEGLRVPIVTGTQADDLAGTLTYYFDSQGKVQRLMLHGFTGDPSRLVQALTDQFELKSEPTLEAGVYTKRWNGRPVHFFRLTHAPVVYSDAVHQKYTVFLELNQPNLPFGISAEAKRIVQSDRKSGRW